MDCRSSALRALSLNEPKKNEFKINNLDKDFEEVKSKELGLKIEVPLNIEVTVAMPAMKPGVYPYKVDFKHSTTGERNVKIIESKIIVKYYSIVFLVAFGVQG
jgi:hypothetical protein